MDFSTWDTLLNFILLIFWLPLWNRSEDAGANNPYLLPLERTAERFRVFFQPVFGRLPAAATFLFLFLFVLIFRAVVLPAEAVWSLRIGFAIRRVQAENTGATIAFSLLSFAIFLFRIWTFSLLYVRQSHPGSQDPTRHMLARLADPFVRLPAAWRPPLLLACGMLLVALLDQTGAPVRLQAMGYTIDSRLHPQWNSLLFTQTGLLALAGLVDVLAMLQSFMILLIIGSWVSMFSGSSAMHAFCREWLQMILGPMRRFPLRLGMFDLTPIVFFLVVGFLHTTLLGLLYQSFAGLAS